MCVTAKSVKDMGYDPDCPIPKGSRIKKIVHEPTDTHPPNSMGITVAGIINPEGEPGYWIVWDNQIPLPSFAPQAYFIVGTRITDKI